MGRILNPGSDLFNMSLNSQIYVDKTGLINFTNSVINTNQRFLCVSRPRRFGKTMAMNMLSAYYDCTTDAREIFEGLKVTDSGKLSSDDKIKKAKDKAEADFDKYANKYNVVHINMLEFLHTEANVSDMVTALKNEIVEELMEEYQELSFSEKDSLVKVMYKSSNYLKKQFVILIDEWDCIFRERSSDSEGQKEYLDFLRAWLKDQPYVAMAYMTGILPIKKYGKHSALNMFREFSMEDQRELEEYTGFTSEDVIELCQKYNMDYTQCKVWYNGYRMKKVHEIYNPLSVVEAMLSGSYANYWNTTETYEALKEYISLNFDGIKDIVISLLAGGSYKINTRKFQNDMTTFNTVDDVLTLLVHLGYLAYDSEKAEVFIPNYEIRTEFYDAVEDDNDMKQVVSAIKKSNELLQATLSGDDDRVAELIEAAHLETSHIQYNDENALSYTISLAYYTARNKYKIVREMPAGKGFADMVFMPLPHHPELAPIVVELKWDKSADTAIKQIKDKKYLECLKGYEGKIILAGINYDKTTRKHTCVIEKA